MLEGLPGGLLRTNAPSVLVEQMTLGAVCASASKAAGQKHTGLAFSVAVQVLSSFRLIETATWDTAAIVGPQVKLIWRFSTRPRRATRNCWDVL